MTQNTRPNRVLVVEDNFDTANMFVELLRAMKQEATFALDGVRALELLPVFQPNLVFVDIGLPRMDGYTLVKKLRAISGPSSLRIYALTAYSGDEYQARSIAAGCDRHIVKPIHIELLEDLLRRGPN